MFKVNKGIAKKSIKQMMVISAMATLLMAALSSLPTMKSYAQRDGMDFMKMVPGMGGSDRSDKGSIGADSLLGCFGVATDCINKDNNNRHTHVDIDRTTPPVTTPPVTTPPVNGTCGTCFADFLNPTQLANVKFFLGEPKIGSDATLCNIIKTKTQADLTAAVTDATVLGDNPVGHAVATNIINCLIAHGVILPVG